MTKLLSIAVLHKLKVNFIIDNLSQIIRKVSDVAIFLFAVDSIILLSYN